MCWCHGGREGGDKALVVFSIVLMELYVPVRKEKYSFSYCLIFFD